jgi:hypothetical protein
VKKGFIEREKKGGLGSFVVSCQLSVVSCQGGLEPAIFCLGNSELLRVSKDYLGRNTVAAGSGNKAIKKEKPPQI